MRASTLRLGLALTLGASLSAVWAADAPKGALRPPPVVQTFVAKGPTTEADLARLRTALEKTAGVVTVEARPTVGGYFVDVKGDVLFTLLAARAKPAGYQFGQLPIRVYTAKGESEDSDLAKLRTALAATPGVEEAAISPAPSGGAVRISGIAPYVALVAAAKGSGYELRQVGGFVVAGSSAEGRLEKLKAALAKAPKVEQVELLALTGGATLLIYGDVKSSDLEAAAKSLGYDFSALGNGFNKRAEFTIGGMPSSEEQEKLRTAIQNLEGTQRTEVQMGESGPKFVVEGERLKPDRIAAAAKEAGFDLRMIESVALPTLTPQAGRVAPAAYDDAIVEDPIVAGEAAPEFTLLSQDGTSKLSLSSSLGKKPVVLIFGSCT
jgi:copper chaperone CopZ